MMSDVHTNIVRQRDVLREEVERLLIENHELRTERNALNDEVGELWRGAKRITGTSDARLGIIERLRTTAEGVLDGYTSNLRTHWEGCHVSHAGCLAALVLTIIEEESDD